MKTLRAFMLICATISTPLLTYSQEWSTVGTYISRYAGKGSLHIAKDGSIYVVYDNLGNATMLNTQKMGSSDWEFFGSKDFSQGPASVHTITSDNNGVPYVAYRDMKRNERCIVQMYDGGWRDVGAGEVSSGFVNSVSVAFDSKNTPYVAFADQANGKLVVHKFENNFWKPLPVVLNQTGDHVTIAFNSQGELYICFADGTNGNKAVVKKFNGSTWSNVGGTASDKEVAYLNFLIDSKGVCYVAFKSVFDGSIQVKKFEGTYWTPVGRSVFSSINTDNISLAIDKNDVPYVAFHSYVTDDKMEIRKLMNGAWTALPSAGAGGGGIGDISIDGTQLYVLFKEDGKGLVVKKLQN